MPQIFSIAQLTSQLLDLGIQPHGVLVIHTAFSKVKPVEGGPLGLIEALHNALGPQGTLVIPSMTSDDSQPFNPAVSPCQDHMGIVADSFWRLPGVLRSDSLHACGAIGPYAALITAPQPVDVPHGLDSPVGRVYELDGQVPPLGGGHGSNTTIHLAENLAGVRYRRQARTMIMQEGAPKLIEYGEVDHCCQNFNLVDGWLDELGFQRKGIIRNATARLMRSRNVVNVVTARLRDDETTFLHPFGVDEECDEARQSIVDK